MPDLPDAHVGVADDIGLVIGKSYLLDVPRSLHSFADGFTGFAETISAEFFVIYARDFDVNVDAVEDGTGDAFLIFGHHAGAQVQGFWVSPKNPQGQGYTQSDIFFL